MRRYNVPMKSNLYVNNSYEGETIETKIVRIVTQNEPIKDGAPLIFTERKQGVLPEYDIRTDRFEIAIDAMDKITKSNLAKRDKKPGEQGAQGTAEPSSGTPEPAAEVGKSKSI